MTKLPNLLVVVVYRLSVIFSCLLIDALILILKPPLPCIQHDGFLGNLKVFLLL